jgi:nucleobase:cation symporter-1, NCS1 family
MIPFVSLIFFQGPAARAPGGAGMSFAVGPAVAGALSCLFSRGPDLGPESAAAQRSRNALTAGTAR